MQNKDRLIDEKEKEIQDKDKQMQLKEKEILHLKELLASVLTPPAGPGQ